MSTIRPFAAFLMLASVVCAAEVTSRDYYDAIRQNDLTALKKMIASGDVNLRDSRGSTPLMHAAAIGSPEAMKLLLAAGADVNIKNGLDSTALTWGALDNAKARILIEAGAGVNVVSKIGRTPLMVAASHPGSADTVRLLLSKGADPKAAMPAGANALIEATRVNDIETVRLLLNHPVDLDAGDRVGCTPLMRAAGHSNLEMVKLLLEKGADVNAAHTAQMRVRNGPIAISRMTALMAAAPLASAEVVEVLLKAGANVNAKDSRGMTPLMFAVAADTPNLRVVRMLLDRGADPNLKSAIGESAIDWAKKFNYPDVLAVLGTTAVKSESVLKPVAHEKPDLRVAIGRATALLQASSTEYFKQSGCVGCHHQNHIGAAVTKAANKGIHVDEAAAAEQIRIVKAEMTGQREVLLQSAFLSVESIAYTMYQFGEQSYPADEVTDAIVSLIASQQAPDGSWMDGFPMVRPPIENSAYVRTALAAKALVRYGIPARKAEMDARIAKARQWLEQAQPKLPYERALQLLGLKWTGADPQIIERVAAELRRLQRPDGGWPQLSHLSSDAYGTGLSLYALHVAGTPAVDPVYQRGVAFLLASQEQDGSWHVRSRSPKIQPYFQGGFPHDHDQWISVAGTAWAVTALVEAVEPARNTAGLVEARKPF